MNLASALSLRQKLANGQNVYGTCITSNAPMWPAALRRVGVDFVFLDTEHIPLGRPELATLCQLFRAYGIVPIVRIPSPDPFLACQAIDGGAGGIVAPYLESVEQIRELVGATKYRPLKGEILAKYLSGAEPVPADLQKYLAHYNGDTLCIANIESVPALERLDELLSVAGLDAVFIGPHDLSVSMGLPEQYDHPEFERAVRTIIRTCRQKGLSVGIHFSLEPERQVQWIKEGANIVVHSFDVALFTQRLSHDLSLIRQAVGDEVLSNSVENFIV
ncbi:aldolase/citrate lyase family protein [Rhabdobacter roseus]|uniref:4-hydroxy-2-oxoheptanedioate aldolase n=1 Tax=Rhabdobacter roseus TaxID=1655419 RepID=A0A840TJL5_9BACT|nr:aldolase/citrate lyase family protein [Rhabdobacter roseus]MBB5283624.1 4-hydroxy-2-oxoheptanedioate aldolase [Rhabdobacter roseus]